jgi:DNA-binding MarR family transcriptional regulator
MEDFARMARTVARECAGLRIREASRILTRVYDAALRPVGLQSSQFSVLVAVAIFGEKGANVGPLAKRLVMDRTTMSRNIQPLEKAGLVRVSRSPDDARARIVTLTRAGERSIEKAYPLWEGAQQRVLKLLGATKLNDLRTQLDNVVAIAADANEAASF